VKYCLGPQAAANLKPANPGTNISHWDDQRCLVASGAGQYYWEIERLGELEYREEHSVDERTD
jgi:hypothetical protein